MKIDAKVKLYGNDGRVFDWTCPVDIGHLRDGEEAILCVQDEIRDAFDGNARYGRDFSIPNLEEIEDAIFNKAG